MTRIQAGHDAQSWIGKAAAAGCSDQTALHPTQQGTTVPASAYDPSTVARPAAASRTEVLTAAVSQGGRPMTVKSSYNRLAYRRTEQARPTSGQD